MHFTMTEILHQRVTGLLEELLRRSEAEAVYFCDKGGNIVAHYALTEYEKEDNMVALAAGSFYATREVARLLGEDEFQCVFHQGDENSIYMQSTAAEMLVLVVFGCASNPGLVKLYASDACLELDQALLDPANDNQAELSMDGTVFEIDEAAQPFTRAQ